MPPPALCTTPGHGASPGRLSSVLAEHTFCRCLTLGLEVTVPCAVGGPLLGPPACPVLSVFWALTPGVVLPRAVIRKPGHHPSAPHRLVGRVPSHLHLLGFWSPTEAHVGTRDAEHCGPGAGGRGLAHPGRHRQGGGNQSGLILFGNDGRMVRVLLQPWSCTVGSGPVGDSRPFWRRQGKRGLTESRREEPPPCWVGIRPRKAFRLGSYWPGPAWSWGPVGRQESRGLIRIALCPGVTGVLSWGPVGRQSRGFSCLECLCLGITQGS